jgi:hypothetical protein
MTVKELAEFILPFVRKSLTESKPHVIEEVGRPAWILLWPAWQVVVGPLLPVLTRVGIEIGIGLSAKKLIPVLAFIDNFSEFISEKYLPELDKKFIADFLELVKTPRSAMLEGVQQVLDTPPGGYVSED